jgi:hypothetical protein
MAHFAILKAGNIVDQVVVVSNDIAITEQAGIVFLRNLYKDQHLPVIQTSYNTYGGANLLGGTQLRKNFASVGYQYDQQRDAFIAPKPFNSWLLDEDKAEWKAPVDMPTDDKKYTWNEDTLAWVEVTEETA